MNRFFLSFGMMSVTCVAAIFAQDPPPVAMYPAQVRRDLIEHATVKPMSRISFRTALASVPMLATRTCGVTLSFQ